MGPIQIGQKLKRFVDFEIKKVENEPRTYWFTASTSDRDRMGDVIVQSGWRLQAFRKNPVVLWAHDNSGLPVGRANESRVEDGDLRLKVEFVPEDIYPFAGTVDKMVDAGFLRTGSVGFTVYDVKDLTEDDKKSRPEMEYGKRLYGELLEFSIVPVPANPHALADKEFKDLCAKSYGNNNEVLESPLLPFKNNKGEFSEKVLRASWAALAGARGGVPIDQRNWKAHRNHLIKVANENGVSLPPISSTGISQDQLKAAFDDVWHNELLDVIDNAVPHGTDTVEEKKVEPKEDDETKLIVAQLNQLTEVIKKA